MHPCGTIDLSKMVAAAESRVGDLVARAWGNKLKHHLWLSPQKGSANVREVLCNCTGEAVLGPFVAQLELQVALWLEVCLCYKS